MPLPTSDPRELNPMNGLRPRVNLPPWPAQWVPPHPYTSSQSAPVSSLMASDHSPPLVAGMHPTVRLPPNPSIQTRHPSHLRQSSQANGRLEERLQNMILSNGLPCSDPNTAAAAKGYDPYNNNRQRGRNQQHNSVQEHDAQQNVQSQGHPSQDIARSRGPQSHIHGNRPQPISHARTNAGNKYHNPSQHTRPPPQNRQLYNPNTSVTSSYQYGRGPLQDMAPRAYSQAQIDYLDRLASTEIPLAEITPQELEEKQSLRKVLEDICRKAVFEHEIRGRFMPESVELRCFGSLSTTFATRSSDMDLVLLSPASDPDASSPDSEIPRIIEKALLSCGYGARLLTSTRVPIIKFCEKPSPGLAALLFEERSKWEKEQDKDRPDPTLPQNRADSTQPTAGGDQKIGRRHGNRKPSNNISQDKPSLKLSLKQVQVPRSAEKDENHVSQSKLDPEPMPKDLPDNEEDDPSLLSKPDEERVRLYKLAMKEEWYEPSERATIMKFIRAFERHNATHDQNGNSNLENARKCLLKLPNVLRRYRAPQEKQLDFPKSGVGIQCDINFSNHLALRNSLLLRCYSLCDLRVRKIVLFVKSWSKKRKINSPYHGTLSSYGYVLMVLHYLVNIAFPPVLPNLQRHEMIQKDEASASEVTFDGHNVQFFRNEREIQRLASLRQLTVMMNQESLGSLIRGFFHYFAQQGYDSPAGGFQWTHDVLSLRTQGGILPKQTKGWTGAKTDTVEMTGPGPQKTKEIRQRYLFAIEDPFEIEHNIARTVVHNGIVAIRDEFRRAHNLIERCGVNTRTGPEDLFAEAESKDNLNYRAFGPRPRKEGESNKGVGKEVNGKIPEKAAMTPNAGQKPGSGGFDKGSSKVMRGGAGERGATTPNVDKKTSPGVGNVASNLA